MIACRVLPEHQRDARCRADGERHRPTSGLAAGGTVVTITGIGFSVTPGATQVVFGGAGATAVSSNSTTSCSATSPAGTIGGRRCDRDCRRGFQCAERRREVHLHLGRGSADLLRNGEPRRHRSVHEKVFSVDAGGFKASDIYLRRIGRGKLDWTPATGHGRAPRRRIEGAIVALSEIAAQDAPAKTKDPNVVLVLRNVRLAISVASRSGRGRAATYATVSGPIGSPGAGG